MRQISRLLWRLLLFDRVKTKTWLKAFFRLLWWSWPGIVGWSVQPDCRRRSAPPRKKNNHGSSVSFSWKHFSIRFLSEVFLPFMEEDFSGLTLNLALLCSMSYLSSGAGECMAALPSSCSLVHHPLDSGSPSPQRLFSQIIVPSGLRRILGAFFATEIRRPLCQNTYTIMQPNSLQLSWATLSIKVESANCSLF